MISVKKFAVSFANAVRGVVLVFRTEQSFRIQILASLLVLFAGWALNVTRNEWLVLILLIGAVLVLELINSVFERMIDTFKPRLHPAVRDMKDMVAGAVLVVSLAALCIGLIIFLPKLQLLWPAFRF